MTKTVIIITFLFAPQLIFAYLDSGGNTPPVKTANPFFSLEVEKKSQSAGLLSAECWQHLVL
ncbi:MAG TPA: hypothetical protein ENN43_02270 [bacterium]|nr:hypothetical protein [bacterium]